MKKLALILLAALTLAACEKDHSASINNTRWYYKNVEPDYQGYNRIITYSLSLHKGGELLITDKYNGPSTEWNDRFRYYVIDYTLTDETHGTITYRDLNHYYSSAIGNYGDTTTHTFILKAKGTKMSLSSPYGSATLELQ